MGVDFAPLINQSTENQVDEKTEDGIKHYRHIISPPENKGIFALLVRRGNSDPSAQDIVDVARVNHLEVTAICGYKWIPTRNPEDHDTCPICVDVAGMHVRNAGGL
jgi:hypothetical protein